MPAPAKWLAIAQHDLSPEPMGNVHVTGTYTNPHEKTDMTAKQKKYTSSTVGFEAQLWAAADKMRGYMDSGEEQENDGEAFTENMQCLTRQPAKQMAQSVQMDEKIKRPLAKIGFTL